MRSGEMNFTNKSKSNSFSDFSEISDNAEEKKSAIVIPKSEKDTYFFTEYHK